MSAHHRAIAPLSAGHSFTDLNPGAVPALLPFFVAEYHLSHPQAAGRVFAATVLSSVIFFGLNTFLSLYWINTLGQSQAAGGGLMVLGQALLPGRVGVASGVTIGLPVSVGGATAPLLGWLADQFGILASLAVLPLLIALLLWTLPRMRPAL